ncbi:MAG: glycosyltransferase [Chloroflexi bacterium]|nr:glycosyltransferase [Chloroflexota bacterium]
MRTISIALCTRNRPHHLSAWMHHMHTIMLSATHTIIIIDQSDIPLTQHWPAHITYVHTPHRGLARARNLALQYCTTPYILFTDDDCRPAPDWLLHAHACITRDPTVALWFGQATPSGSDYQLHDYPTHAGYTTWASRANGDICHAVRRATPPFRTVQPVAVLECLGHGNQMLMQCAVVRNLGGFHPWLGAGAWLLSGEDVDMAMRLLQHGYACAYTPTLHIIHDAWMTPAAHAHSAQHSSTGMIAVHVAHAWHHDPSAIAYLRFRWHHVFHQTHTTSVASAPPVPAWRRIIAIVHGIIGGMCLVVHARWRRRA